MIVIAAIRYFSSLKSKLSVAMIVLSRKPIKMETPPNVGTTTLLTFLSLGVSYRCLAIETLMRGGIVKITRTKPIAKPDIEYNMSILDYFEL
jgi:hypothetical protein